MKNETMNLLVRSNQIVWEPLNEPGVSGIFVKSLRYDDENKRSVSFLLKFEPGARYPLHNHPGGEEAFVLEGSIKFAGDTLNAGDYLYTAINKSHGVSSEEGCVVLFVVPQEVEILKARK